MLVRVVEMVEDFGICVAAQTLSKIRVVSDPTSLRDARGAKPNDRPSADRGPIAWSRWGPPAASAAGFAVGLTLELVGTAPWAAVTAYLLGVLVGGWGPGRDGLAALRDRRLDVDLLMVVAAIAAAALGQWRDAALLILIFAVSAALEDAASARTAAGVRSLLVSSPERADLIGVDGTTHAVPVEQLAVDDRVLVRQGARVPIDGVVLEGEAAIDESSLTGESLPVRKIAGRSVLAGSLVTEGALVVRVAAVAGDSVLARLAAAVSEAVEQRPPTQLLVERFEQRYSIGVVVAAVALAATGPWLFGWDGSTTVTRVMTFLVVASPCALVLSTMPATLAALAVAARRGVLVRGGTVLERLADVDVVAFDKTGTLTTGQPTVTAIHLDEIGSTDELLALAAAAEAWSEHPIGHAILAAAADRSLSVPAATNVEVRASRGVSALVGGRRVRVGGAALLGELPLGGSGGDGDRGSVVGVEIDGRLAGRIVLTDRVRPEASCTVACLERAGVAEMWLLTGDRAPVAGHVGETVGIDRRRHDLLPGDKAAEVARLGGGPRQVVYVGDGVNDAAALATAAVGVSLGQRGAALAVDTADLVLIDDHLHHLPDLVHLARRTRRVVRTNLWFALSVIVVLVGLDLAGRLPLVLGVMGHEGSSLLVALNGLRLLRWRPPAHPASASSAGPGGTADRARRRWSRGARERTVLDGAIGTGHDQRCDAHPAHRRDRVGRRRVGDRDGFQVVAPTTR
ncbi:MAG: heavy metal translocating P-type ATPase [Desertimonas sp.]